MARTSSLKASGDGMKRLAELGRQLQRRPNVKVGVFAGSTSITAAKTKVSKRTTKVQNHGYGVTRTTRITGVTHQGASARSTALSMVQVAIINEFREDVGPGGGGPARAPLRSTADAKKEEWFRLLERTLTLAVNGKIDLRRGLELVGQRASADVKQRILRGEGIPPPNAPSTIARKGSSRPLVDTGGLVNSYSYQVEEG